MRRACSSGERVVFLLEDDFLGADGIGEASVSAPTLGLPRVFFFLVCHVYPFESVQSRQYIHCADLTIRMGSNPVGHFIKFCMDANIDIKKIGESLKKYFLAYQRNILHRPAFDTLFGETAQFINWDYVERGLPKLDSTHWIQVFRYMQFASVPRAKSELQRIEMNLRDIGADVDLACHVFLLKNTNFITSQYSIERLFSEHKVSDAYNKSLQFFAKSADSAFDVKETTALFCHIMNTAVIDEAELEKHIQFLKLREDELVSNFRVKQLRATGRRPKLRSKLSSIQKESRSVFDMDTFHSWCQCIRFPSVFSLHTKHKLYFLMSQINPHVPQPHSHVHTITRDGFVCAALSTALVQKPEHDILHKVIVSMRLIEEPFKELQDFRCECMGAFPATQLNSMKLNDLLHMYVCAYQNPLAWKDIWKQLVPLLSHQVIRDVETFTHRRKFNFDSVLKNLNEE